MLSLLSLLCGLALPRPQTVSPTPIRPLPAYSDAQFLDEVERRAFRFFWEQADPQTGLVKDRADNTQADKYDVASIASTGYALAALPAAVERKWVGRAEAEKRAELTLDFLLHRFHDVHGWRYHFINMRTGARVWNSELSSIDTALLVEGALVAGQYFRGEVQRLANALYDRLDWTWMRTNGGAKPEKILVCMGWRPDSGFMRNDWDSYNECPLIYLLGMGARRNPLPPASWTAWKRSPVRYYGLETLAGGPIFLHEMPYEFYRMKDLRDRLGYDYWVSATNGVTINRKYCIDLAGKRKTYGPDIWGLNASDGPKGYNAYGVPQPEDGTVSPTGALAAITFIPEEAKAAGREMYARYGDKIWGRYGFADAFNLDVNWVDPDVIGIDLGMVLLAVENHRSGLIWRLLASHPSTGRAFKAAGFHLTSETAPRALRVNGASRRQAEPYRWEATSSPVAHLRGRVVAVRFPARVRGQPAEGLLSTRFSLSPRGPKDVGAKSRSPKVDIIYRTLVD